MLDKELKEYIPGKSIEEVAKLHGLLPQNIIKLGSNENPLGASERVRGIISEILNNNFNFGIYPDALSMPVETAIKNNFPEIGSAKVVVGNGMDHILECLSRLLLRNGDKTLIHIPTFEYYEIITRWQGAEPIFHKTYPENNFKINLDEFLSQITKDVKLVFLCNPNNPTCSVMAWAEIERILQKATEMGAFVFLDEAYSEFATETHINKVQNFENLIIGKTFSKIYGLASMRIGWAVLHKKILSDYRKVQTPFNVNSLSQIAAITALKDKEHVNKTLDMNKHGILFLERELINLNFKVFSGNTNFISFMSEDFSAKQICTELLKQGIIVRDASMFRGAPTNLVRTTIGKEEENIKLINCIKDLISI